MMLDRNRVAKLIELADLERRVTGPERALHEAAVAVLVKAAYDDASEAARAEFMTRVRPMPTSAWPWTAVQVQATRPGVARGARGVAIGPKPRPVTPAALVLLRGQVASPDAEPGNRLPDRGSPDGAAWEPLFRALDAWDTKAIARWIGPQGWVSPTGVPASPSDADQGAPAMQPGGPGVGPGGGMTPSASPPTAFSWRSPAVLAAGATVASTVGVVLFSLRHRGPNDSADQEEP